jgi:hypothetical protein
MLAEWVFLTPGPGCGTTEADKCAEAGVSVCIMPKG